MLLRGNRMRHSRQFVWAINKIRESDWLETTQECQLCTCTQVKQAQRYATAWEVRHPWKILKKVI